MVDPPTETSAPRRQLDAGLLAERIGGLVVGGFLAGSLALDTFAAIDPDPVARIGATNGAFAAVGVAIVILAVTYVHILRRENRS